MSPRTDVASQLRSGRAARLARFVAQRFPLAFYGPLIAALVICGRTAAALASDARSVMDWPAIGTGLAVASAFLQLRILDDIRDAATDRVGRPERPLPGGLVTETELRAFALVLALAGIALTAPSGIPVLAAYSLALVTIWVLGRDPARRLPFRLGILGEALTHSVIVPELLLVAWASVANPEPSAALAATLLLAWGASLTIEVARKTLSPAEERPGIVTYSAAFGRPRAMLLAALAVSVTGVGAAGLAIASQAGAATAVVPLIAAGSIPVLTLRYSQRIGTSAMRTTAVVLVLSLLLWPLVIMLGTP